MYGQFSRAVSNQERVMMVRIRYFNWQNNASMSMKITCTKYVANRMRFNAPQALLERSSVYLCLRPRKNGVCPGDTFQELKVTPSKSALEWFRSALLATLFYAKGIKKIFHSVLCWNYKLERTKKHLQHESLYLIGTMMSKN